jgi:hypothetical protein
MEKRGDRIRETKRDNRREERHKGKERKRGCSTEKMEIERKRGTKKRDREKHKGKERKRGKESQREEQK